MFGGVDCYPRSAPVPGAQQRSNVGGFGKVGSSDSKGIAAPRGRAHSVEGPVRAERGKFRCARVYGSFCDAGRAHSADGPKTATLIISGTYELLTARQAETLISISISRTAPGPLFRVCRQARLYRVILDIATRSRLMLIISHISVPVTLLPKSPTSTEKLIYLLAGISLPRLDQFPHGNVLHEKQEVRVIWHHSPRTKIVTFTVEIEERVFHQAGNIRARKWQLPLPRSR